VLIETLIGDLSKDPFNPQLNFDVACEYDKHKQTASAVSFYLRTAEYGKDSHPSLVYASLLRLAKCFEEQHDRLHTVSNCILQALAYLPYRAEGYFWMSRFFERQREYQESYTWAQIGLNNGTVHDPEIDLEYTDYCLLFEKGVAAWWIGRKDEAIEIFNNLLTYDLTPEYKQVVQDNLARIQ
jgi:tetratricopeptide (TPR) repeat protein